MLVDRDRLGQN
ncbi:hypothetical protein YPPY56_4809, partial [Yersinia pestis PY-56]